MSSRKALATGVLLVATLLILLEGSANAARLPSADEESSQAFLVINEYMASNNGGLQDPDEPGEFPDWIELHNTGTVAVSLDGLSIVKGSPSDTPVTFNITDGLSIGPGGFMLFLADSDPEQGPTHTNFKLRKEGDVLALFASNGSQEIDRRTFGAQATDISEGRVPDGSDFWQRLDAPTPGAPNVTTAPKVLDVNQDPPLPTASDEVKVTVLISDAGTIVSATLVYSAAPSGLSTVPMSTADGHLFSARIPAYSTGTVVRYFVTAVDNDGYAAPNPGTPEGSGDGYLVGYTKPTLVINEVMAANDSIYMDPEEKGEFPDWLELHNYGSAKVSLDGLYLTDNPQRVPSGRTKFAITDGLSIPSGGYMVFIADDDEQQGPLHLSFQLEESGESVALYAAFGLVELDRLDYGEQISDSSTGRFPDGEPDSWGLLYCATPGAANLLCDEQVYLPIVTR